MQATTAFAKKLRKNSTETERLLWSHLRQKQFLNLRFRRQEPIGEYIVDFVCYEKLVIIECDGGQHTLQVESDRERDRWFLKQGYSVLRFWDHEVFENKEGVLDTIFEVCRRSPSP